MRKKAKPVEMPHSVQRTEMLMKILKVCGFRILKVLVYQRS